MKENYLTVLFAITTSLLLIALAVTGVKYQQAVSKVEQQQEQIIQLQGDIDEHWTDVQGRMREAAR